VTRLEEQKDPRVTEEVKWLARGPNYFVKRYSGYFVKGYCFHTKDHEKLLKTQNSGVVVNVVDASTQRVANYDGRLKDIVQLNYSGKLRRVANYYGRLKDIVQLNYSGKLRVVLFQCDWVDIDKGCKTDEFGIKLVNFSYLTHKGDNLLDDTFVLASQVDKVFYAHDSKLGDWMVARHVKVKDAFNMQCDTDENILSSLPYSNAVPSLHRVDDDVEDGVDGTLVLESQKVEDDENEQE
nr:hypothetical protein [Tanacetum cinerariifolium]